MGEGEAEYFPKRGSLFDPRKMFYNFSFYLHKGIFLPHSTYYPSHTLSILPQHFPCVIH